MVPASQMLWLNTATVFMRNRNGQKAKATCDVWGQTNGESYLRCAEKATCEAIPRKCKPAQGQKAKGQTRTRAKQRIDDLA